MAEDNALNAWMDRAASGDADAFGALSHAVQDDLYRFALAHGLCAADAAEAVQETLTRAFAARCRWQPGREVRTWLCGIALNVAREFRRRRRDVGGMDADIVQATEPGPDRSVDPAALAKALGDLPPRQREAITCRYLRGMSVRDTAAAMECAEGTVKAAVFAGLAAMRKRLEERV